MSFHWMELFLDSKRFPSPFHSGKLRFFLFSNLASQAFVTERVTPELFPFRKVSYLFFFDSFTFSLFPLSSLLILVSGIGRICHGSYECSGNSFLYPHLRNPFSSKQKRKQKQNKKRKGNLKLRRGKAMLQHFGATFI